MKIKVCGMQDIANIEELVQLPIDFIGFIFYPKSPRFVDKLPEEFASNMSENIKRVGVFVNENADVIIDKIQAYNLDIVQLHGNESPEFCGKLKSQIVVIKSFSVSGSSDFGQTKAYEEVCDYFLFDTKTHVYGGSGLKFDWTILDTYQGSTPFILSGGISSTDVETIKNIKHPKFFAIDLNSKFEIEPGLKDITLLSKFIKSIKDE